MVAAVAWIMRLGIAVQLKTEEKIKETNLKLMRLGMIWHSYFVIIFIFFPSFSL